MNFKKIIFTDKNGNDYSIIDICSEIAEGVLFFLMIPYFLLWVLPKELWLNRKLCPYWDYPSCKMHSNVRMFKDKPCRLGEAKNHCLHYKE